MAFISVWEGPSWIPSNACSHKGYPTAGSDLEGDWWSKGCERLTPDGGRAAVPGADQRTCGGCRNMPWLMGEYLTSQTLSRVATNPLCPISQTLWGYLKGRRKENKVEESWTYFGYQMAISMETETEAGTGHGQRPGSCQLLLLSMFPNSILWC